MKRSKVFLGITSGLLAIAGLAASKAKFTGLHPFYYTAQGNVYQGICKLDASLHAPWSYDTLTTLNPARLTTLYGSVSRKLYETALCYLPVYIGTDK
jgi:hypothetical protein